MPNVSVLLIGDTQRAEFREGRESLDGLGVLFPAHDIEAACTAIGAGHVAPDLIVVAQAYPNQFSHEEIDRVRRLAPVARLVGLLGSWCEGETRTGEAWPAAIRIYWHQWPARIFREVDRLRRGKRSPWGLPITAGDEERLLLLAEQPVAKRSGLIVLATPSHDMQDWLATACGRRGYSSQWLRAHDRVEVPPAAAAIFDGNDCRGREEDWLKQLGASLGTAPIVALLDFPRTHDCDRALAAGARAVVSKPFLVADLFWHIDRLVADAPSRPDRPSAREKNT